MLKGGTLPQNKLTKRLQQKICDKTTASNFMVLLIGQDTEYSIYSLQ
jgi:hypothetical protein